MNPPVAYLAILQFHLPSYVGHGRVVPPGARTHLVCGGEQRVWGATLCGLPFGNPGDAHSTVAGGVCTNRHATRTCWSCVATARLFPGTPIRGIGALAQPIADALGVTVLRSTPPQHTPTSTPPRSNP